MISVKAFIPSVNISETIQNSKLLKVPQPFDRYICRTPCWEPWNDMVYKYYVKTFINLLGLFEELNWKILLFDFLETSNAWVCLTIL